jgi:hypothetical protein
MAELAPLGVYFVNDHWQPTTNQRLCYSRVSPVNLKTLVQRGRDQVVKGNKSRAFYQLVELLH